MQPILLNRKFRVGKTIQIMIGLLMVSAVMAQAQNKQDLSLFDIVSVDTSTLPVKQTEIFNSIKEHQATKNIHLIRMESAGLTNTFKLSITLPSGINVRAERNELIIRSQQSFTWAGSMVNNLGHVVLTVYKDKIEGRIRYKNQLFSLRSLGDDDTYHMLIEQDLSEYSSVDHIDFYDKHSAITGLYQFTKKLYSTSTNTFDSEEELDVLVAYTNAAESAYGGNIETAIQSAVDLSNITYGNSEIDLSLNLVGTYKVDYTESGVDTLDLIRFRGTDDGYMDEIHSLRNQVMADVAILISDASAFCGAATTILAGPNYAFGIVNIACLPELTFTHEIGHLQRARHNPLIDDKMKPFPFGHGYVECQAQFPGIQ